MTEQVTTVTELPAREIPFTTAHEKMITEIHGVLMQLGSAVSELLPKLEGTPFAKMLGL